MVRCRRLWISPLDDRIVAAAPGCFLTTFRKLIETRGPQDGEQNIAGQIAFGMDISDYVIMRAPKPTVVCSATRDRTFEVEGRIGGQVHRGGALVVVGHLPGHRRTSRHVDDGATQHAKTAQPLQCLCPHQDAAPGSSRHAGPGRVGQGERVEQFEEVNKGRHQ